LLFAESVKTYPYLPPGQMATNSTVCFMLAGLSLLTINWEAERGWAPTQWFALLGVAIATLADLGYIFGRHHSMRSIGPRRCRLRPR
jgi:hypothetical protein